MITAILLTFLTSGNLFLHDICSYFSFSKIVLSYVKRFLFPVKSKKDNVGGLIKKSWVDPNFTFW